MQAEAGEQTALRIAHIEYLMSLVPEQIMRSTWSRRQIEDEQLAATRRLLTYAKKSSDWYRDRLDRIDTNTITIPDFLDRVPTLSKRELMSNWDAIVTIPGLTFKDTADFVAESTSFSYFSNRLVALASSGTSGLAGIFLYDWHSWAVNHAAMLRSTLPLIIKYSSEGAISTASVSANAPTHFSSLVAQCFSPPGSAVVRLPISLPIEEIVERLNQANPTFLHCFPSYVRILCREASADRLKISPKIVFCTSEPLTNEDAKIARSTWGSLVLSSWSTSETVGTTPCLAGSGFHVLEDLNIIEGLGLPNALGESGGVSEGILITNLYNLALPLIRYEISDRFEFSSEDCGCGSHYRHVAAVHGRVDELFLYGDVVVHPGVLESAFAEDARITDYQFNQTPGGVDVLIVSMSDVDLSSIGERLTCAIRALGLAEPDVRVRQVQNIDRSKTGKARRSIALG